LKDDTPERAQFVCENCSFSLIAGEQPTENLHMAFGASENTTVDASTVPRSRPATATTARPASDRSSAPATTAPSCWTASATTKAAQ